MPDLPYDVFISYARKDGKQHAVRLQRELEKRGLRVWRDERNLDLTRDFGAEIENAIESSRYVVVCITPDARRDDSFVRREIGYAGLEEINKPILVARFEKVPVPILVVNNTRLDFFTDWESSFVTLLRWLKGVAVDIPKSELEETEFTPTDLYKTFLENQLEMVVGLIRNRSLFEPVVEARFLRDLYAETDWDGRLLLLGEPGAGKTTTLLAFTRDKIAARLNDPTQPLPVFAQVAGWDSRNQTPLYEWLAHMHEELNADTLRFLIEGGEALLLLDGLDELGSRRPVDPNDLTKGDYDPRERFLKALPPNGKIILTSRIEDYRQIGKRAKLSRVVRFKPFSDAQMRAYLADVPGLWEVISADDNLRNALRTPLLLALVRVGFEDAPDEARILRDLSAGDLNDRIWNAFIDQRWAHEQARQPDIRLPYTATELKQRLGMAVVNAMFDRKRDDYTCILARDIGGDDADTVVMLAQRLDVLRPAGDEPVGRYDTSANFAPTYRFLHLRLRDSLTFLMALAALHVPDKYVRNAAAGALGVLGDVRALEPLIAALRDPEGHVRGSAAWALSELGDHGIEPLIAALHDQDHTVRFAGVIALGMGGNAHAVEPLIVALSEPDNWVRSSAAAALGAIGDARAVEPLIAALYDPEGNVRGSAAEALGKLGDDRAVRPLIFGLCDPDELVRHSAATALLNFPDHPTASSALADYAAGKLPPRTE